MSLGALEGRPQGPPLQGEGPLSFPVHVRVEDPLELAQEQLLVVGVGRVDGERVVAGHHAGDLLPTQGLQRRGHPARPARHP
jgi:hypothetical protein